jgi:hypothetical protein
MGHKNGKFNKIPIKKTKSPLPVFKGKTALQLTHSCYFNGSLNPTVYGEIDETTGRAADYI